MGRVEILTGAERRRDWSDDQKLAILEEVVSSGLGVSVIARRHDVLPQQIYAWRRQFRAVLDTRRSGPAFLPVTVIASEPAEQASHEQPAVREKPAIGRSARIEIRCKGGRVLRIEAGLDAEILRGLIRSVEGA